MRQFLFPEDWHWRGGPVQQLTLTASDHHYLARVRRVRPGDRFPGADHAGRRYQITVRACTARSTVLEVSAPAASHGVVATGAGIDLIQCLPKGHKFDQIVRQTTELGVRQIIPVISRHVMVSQAAPSHLHRWQRVARQATQQSGRTGMPVIHPPTELAQVAGLTDASVRLLFCEAGAQTTLHKALAQEVTTVACLVGPEGGLSPEEQELMRSQGFVLVWLGNEVLRSETAAVCAVATVKQLLLERGAWTPT